MCDVPSIAVFGSESTRVVPKVMSNNFLHANWEQQTKESIVIDGTSYCVILSFDVNSLHHVTSITPNKMAENDMSFRQRAVIEFLVKEEILAAEIHQRLQWKCVHGCEQCSKMGETF